MTKIATFYGTEVKVNVFVENWAPRFRVDVVREFDGGLVGSFRYRELSRAIRYAQVAIDVRGRFNVDLPVE